MRRVRSRDEEGREVDEHDFPRGEVSGRDEASARGAAVGDGGGNGGHVFFFVLCVLLPVYLE